MRRVVITGMGIVSPVGNSIETFRDSIMAGRHGIAKLDDIEMTGQKVSLAARVKDFDSERFIEKKEGRRMDLSTKFAVAAAQMAIDDCGTEFRDLDPYRVGVLIGTGVGGLETMTFNQRKFYEKGPHGVSPLMIPMIITNMPAATVAIRFGYKGVNYANVSACATSNHAIGEAMHAIRHGYADVILAGGTEATIIPYALAGFANMTALCQSDDPDRASIPFDAERCGFVMGEGAGVLVLEELGHALARGARIYAELAGYGATCDAYHITSPDPGGEGAAKSMELAIQDAELTNADIGYINAHGTSTEINDRTETLAVWQLFGEQAAEIPISSTKSMTGHLLGAAGAVEAIVCTLALREGLLPPTVNYRAKDPECDLDYITEGARKKEIHAALSNSFGFGGHNATLCIKKYDKQAEV